MIALISQYSALINFVLYGTIIGFLFNLQKTSREALTDKFEAQLEALRSKVSLLDAQEKITQANHQAAIGLLEQQLSFYKSLADMPEDKRVLAIKTEYQQKLKELEASIASRAEVESEFKRKFAEVRQVAEETARAPSATRQSVTSVLEQVVRLTMSLLH